MPRIPSERFMGREGGQDPGSYGQSLRPPNGLLGVSGHRRNRPQSLVESPTMELEEDFTTNRPKSMDAATLLPLQTSSVTLSDMQEVFTSEHQQSQNAESKAQFSSSTSRSEIQNALLLVLPFVLIDNFFPYSTSKPNVLEVESAAGLQTRPAALTTLLITSTVLGIAAVYARFGQRNTLSTGKAEITPKPIKLDLRCMQEAFKMAASVGLPIYAGLTLGASYFALLLLLLSAAGLMPLDYDKQNLARLEGWKRLASSKVCTSTCLLASLAAIILWHAGNAIPFGGIIATVLSLLAINPPYQKPLVSVPSNISPPPSSKSTSAVPSSPLGHQFTSDLPIMAAASSLVLPINASTTFIATAVSTLLSFFLVIGYGFVPDVASFAKTTVVAGAFVTTFLFSPPHYQRSARKVGFAVASTAVVFSTLLYAKTYGWTLFIACCAATSYACLQLDDNGLVAASLGHSHGSHHGHSHNHGSDDHKSRLTQFLLHSFDYYPSLHIMLSDKNSRGLFYYMLINLSFMVVQATYAYMTDSLGLMSDSVHMFFDCAALAFGLWARVLSKRPRNARFPYGYGKIEDLSGFGNGVLLLVISVEITYEAVERLFDDHEVKGLFELFIVSSLGLVVNLIGIMSFDHGHSHAGHSHDHSDENLRGIYLHILADLLGSVTVVISTIMIHFFGWSGFDPIASMGIAILIFVSAIPMVQNSAKKLLLALPDKTEYELRDHLSDLTTLRGVVGYTVPRFWLDDEVKEDDHDHHHHHEDHHAHSHKHDHDHDHHHHDHDHDRDHGHDHDHKHNHECQSDPQTGSHHRDHHKHDHDHDHDHEDHHTEKLLGVVHVIATRSADLFDLRRRLDDFMQKKNMDLFVQIEREGDNRCWCGSNARS